MKLLFCGVLLSLLTVPVFSLDKVTIQSDGTLDLYDNGINRIEDIAALYTDAELASVKNLYLDFNQITEMESLDAFPGLEFLSLAGNQISRIEGLENCTNVRFLYLQYNELESMDGIGSLINIEELYLGNNPIHRIGGLENLNKLRILHIYSAELDKIEGLDNLINLEDLSLNSNKIEKMNGLANLKTIQHLSLADNRITKIEGIENCTNLFDLKIQNNPIKTIDRKTYDFFKKTGGMGMSDIVRKTDAGDLDIVD